MAADKRELDHPSTRHFYEQSLELAVRTKKLLSGVMLVSDVRSASDWSYASTTYHIPYARICGDAGCFIDPLFSSGYHLAITGGLSAAVTVAASLRGDYDEQTAGGWHSRKTVESYTRFVLAAGSATTQIRSQELAVMQDIDEDGFQRAFDLLAPIIQGTVDFDVTGNISRSKVSEVLDFCYKAFNFVSPEKKAALFEKLKKLGFEHGTEDYASAEKAEKDAREHLTDEEWQIVKTLRSRRMIREDLFEMDCFTLDAIDGLTPRLERGKLGLMKAQKVRLDMRHFYSPPYLDGIVPRVRQVSPHS